MNNWIIVGVIFGLLVIGGIAAVSAFSPSQEETNPSTTAKCSSCSGKCTAENNCGLATCGAISGGTCNCGR